jgi:hypothetical protein
MAAEYKPQRTKDGFFRVRVSCGETESGDRKQVWLTFHTRDERVYDARVGRVAGLARKLTSRGFGEQALVIIRNAAESATDEAFEFCMQRGELIAGPDDAPRAAAPRKWETFEAFGRAYTSGELERAFKGRFKTKKTIGDDASKLEHLYKTIGGFSLREFSVRHANLAMANLPPTCRSDRTRNHYWQVMHRLLEIAVQPAELIDRNPLLREHRPEMTEPEPEYPYLFPHEDWLMVSYAGPGTCQGVDFARVDLQALFGCCTREGARIDEFLRRLTWGGIDTMHGRLNVGIRKNGRVGTWKAQPGTIETLLALRELEVPRAPWMVPMAEAAPFRLEAGRADGVETVKLASLEGPFFGLPADEKYAERIQALLKAAFDAAGLMRRTELFEVSPGRGKLRAHDTRATFITLAKSLDASESWIMARTGHDHSTMLATYDHARAEWLEHGFGRLVRLDVGLGRERLGLPPFDLAAERARVAAVESTDSEIEPEIKPLEIVRHTIPQKWKSSLFSAVPKPGVEPGPDLSGRILNPPGGCPTGSDDDLSARNLVEGTSPKVLRVSSPGGASRYENDPPEGAAEGERTVSRSSPGEHLANTVATPPAEPAPAAAPPAPPSPEGLVAGLKALAHEALELDDDEALETLRALIKRRKAGAGNVTPSTAEPASGRPPLPAPASDATVLSLDEARRRTR